MGFFTELYLEKVAGRYFPEVDDTGRVPHYGDRFSIEGAKSDLGDSIKNLAKAKSKSDKRALLLGAIGSVLGGTGGALASKRRIPGALIGALAGGGLGALSEKNIGGHAKEVLKSKMVRDLAKHRLNRLQRSVDPAEWLTASSGDKINPYLVGGSADQFQSRMAHLASLRDKLDPKEKAIYDVEKKKFFKSLGSDTKDMIKSMLPSVESSKSPW